MALGKKLKFYAGIAKGLKLKVRNFGGLFPTFAEVTGEKPVGEAKSLPPSWISLRYNFDDKDVNQKLNSLYLIQLFLWYGYDLNFILVSMFFGKLELPKLQILFNKI